MTFLLFIDETGEEGLNDPNYPIFGFGGVGIPASLYVSNISNPWIYLKEKEFGGESISMHAADINKPTKEQLEILNTFFDRCAFCRVATIVSDKTIIDSDVDIYNLVARSFYDRILEVLKNTDYEDVFMIFEESERTNKFNADYFSRYKFSRQKKGEEPTEIQFERLMMSKKEREPGLEVADFVAHTAGASVKSRLVNKKSKFDRKDFKAIFKSPDRRLVSFLEITKAEKTAQPAGGPYRENAR